MAAQDHTLGIHGKLQHVLADANHTEAVICVHHTLGDDLTATTHVTHEQLRKAANVSHMNLLSPKAIKLKTINQSDGVMAISVKGGDGEPLPVTDRHCAHVDGSMLASHLMALPGETSTNEMALKQLSTDKHNFVPVSLLSEEEKQRNKLNAAYYPGLEGVPSDAKLYKDTISASHNGTERIAVPLVDRITAKTGGLSAVASRCLKHQKKRPVDLCSSGSPALVTMPHKATGEDVEHLVADAAAIRAMADTVKANTAVKGTFAKGLQLTTQGLNEHCQPGDHVITQLTIVREPTADPATVTYQKDLMPAEVKSGTVLADAEQGVVSHNDQKWHDAMFAKTKGAAGAVPQIAAIADDAQATPAEPATAEPN